MRDDRLINDGGNNANANGNAIDNEDPNAAIGNNNDPDAIVGTWCCGQIHRRQNGAYDIFCWRGVKKGQIILVIFSLILICLVLYAALG